MMTRLQLPPARRCSVSDWINYMIVESWIQDAVNVTMSLADRLLELGVKPHPEL